MAYVKVRRYRSIRNKKNSVSPRMGWPYQCANTLRIGEFVGKSEYGQQKRFYLKINGKRVAAKFINKPKTHFVNYRPKKMLPMRGGNKGEHAFKEGDMVMAWCYRADKWLRAIVIKVRSRRVRFLEDAEWAGFEQSYSHIQLHFPKPGYKVHHATKKRLSREIGRPSKARLRRRTPKVHPGDGQTS